MKGFYMCRFGYYNMIGYGGFGLLGFIIGVVALALVIYGIVELTRSSFRKDREYTARTQEKGAVDYLKERYAKGEITKEQFEQMKKDIV